MSPTQNFNINCEMQGIKGKVSLYHYVDWALLGINTHENQNSLTTSGESLQHKFWKICSVVTAMILCQRQTNIASIPTSFLNNYTCVKNYTFSSKEKSLLLNVYLFMHIRRCASSHNLQLLMHYRWPKGKNEQKLHLILAILVNCVLWRSLVRISAWSLCTAFLKSLRQILQLCHDHSHILFNTCTTILPFDTIQACSWRSITNNPHTTLILFFSSWAVFTFWRSFLSPFSR
jgi:putative flippase GtrA